MRNRLYEETKSQYISDSRNAANYAPDNQEYGKNRFARRVRSKVANSVKEFNEIDMNKLFKDDILTVDVKVDGETDEYKVKISFGGFCKIVRDQVKQRNLNEVDLRTITSALLLGFNKSDIYVNCTCDDFKYRFAAVLTQKGLNSGQPELRPAKITNPNDDKGRGCKHILLVLNNTSFLLKIASVINNYIKYIKDHYESMYADIIYPALFGKPYEEAAQTSIEDKDELDTDVETIDKSNEYGKTRTQFKQGNLDGVRFTKSSDNKDQVSIFDSEEEVVDDTQQ